MANTTTTPALPPTPLTTALATSAAASAGAGLVHVAAAGTHNGDATLAWLFAATAAAQLAWAALVVLRPQRRLIAAGVALNAGALVAWVLSRTVGLVVPLAEVEAVGTQDLLAAILAGLAVAAGAAALLRRSPVTRANVTAVGIVTVLVLALAMPAMAAEHTHGPSHEHSHGDEATAHFHDDQNATHGDHEDSDGHAHGTETSTEGPIISVDDPRLTEEQQERAEELIDETRTALAEFPDEASLLAVGYVSIGDGRRDGSFEHFVNHTYLADTRELDAGAIESVVTQRQSDGTKRVMSAMYIFPPGSTMDDVPDVAGELSIWHDHQNLCWDPSGQRLAGILVNGECRPGGVLRATAPMLHVWLEDTPCGPFSGIEGHGGSCEHTH